VRHYTKNLPAELCSTGEQKALMIALVLAIAALQARDLGTAPLLLLDEVAAHLDPLRRSALFERMAEIGAQVWLTGTERESFFELEGRAQYFRVGSGAAVPA
jgi:DNA replication and repair protein RecF